MESPVLPFSQEKVQPNDLQRFNGSTLSRSPVVCLVRSDIVGKENLVPPESPSDVELEIGHVLFIDIVGYSKLLIHEQTEQLQKLREIARGTGRFRAAQAVAKLLRLSTG